LEAIPVSNIYEMSQPMVTLPQNNLAACLREATRDLHIQAERSGAVQAMLRGQISRAGYALFLRNLLPAYESLEAGLRRHRGKPGIRHLCRPELHREAAITCDLAALAGADWRSRLALLPAAADYAALVVAADAPALVGHAYTRHLADLSGAQLLRRALERRIGLGPEAQAYYRFPTIVDLAAYRDGYRASLDVAADELEAAGPGATGRIVAAACAGFAANIAVSEAVAAVLAD